jgi:hypothetical protein
MPAHRSQQHKLLWAAGWPETIRIQYREQNLAAGAIMQLRSRSSEFYAAIDIALDLDLSSAQV